MYHFRILADFFRGKTDVQIPNCLTEVSEYTFIAAHKELMERKVPVPSGISTLMETIIKVSGPLP